MRLASLYKLIVIDPRDRAFIGLIIQLLCSNYPLRRYTLIVTK